MAVVTLLVQMSAGGMATERRFARGTSIGELKERLALVAGASPTEMKLSVLNARNELVALLDDDMRLLDSYPLENFMTLFVDVSASAMVRQLGDVSQVEKFELADEEYDRRENSFRKFRQNNPQLFAEADRAAHAEDGADAAAAIQVGMRAETSDDPAEPRRGTVAFVGKVDFAPGYWVGVALDEPLGKHDGEVKGRRYFACPDGHGVFKKAALVAVGDYPEIDPFADEM
eukprot:Amastigsp_a685359_13.p1 type:complete len:230 gc:universal Amastigsp_a685359_13:51-740(+)